jgi:hypothetical protein
MKSARQVSICVLAIMMAMGSLLFRPGLAYAGTPPGPFNKAYPSNGATNRGASESLAWIYDSTVSYYELCASTTDSCNSWQNIGSLPYVQLAGLLPYSTYYWHVRAVNDFGTTYSDGSVSAIWSFTTGGAPTAFNKSGPANGAASQSANPTLSWTANTSAAAYYEYCYSTTNPCTYSEDIYTWGTSIQLSALSPNTTYYWNVRSVNGFGAVDSDGNTTDWSFRTGDVPGTFTKSGPANGAFDQPANPTLSWTASNSATSYMYCLRTTVVDCATHWTLAYGTTSVVLSGLSPSTTYYWNVMANNSFDSTFSDGSAALWSFTTGGPPGAFGKTGPANGATNQPANPTLSWTAASGAGISYEYCYSATNNPCTNWTVTNNTSVQLGSLSPGTAYYWNVRVVNSFGTLYSDGSATDWSFLTAAALPAAFSANPTSWNYGLVKAGTTSAGKSFMVKNIGGSNLVIGSVSLAGVYAVQFRLTANSCSGHTLAPNATCAVNVTFKPTSAGATRTAYINFPDNASGSPHKISLSGRGSTEQALNGGFNTYPGSAARIPSNWLAANFATTDGKNTQFKYEGAASVKIGNTSARTKALTQTRLLSGAKGSTFLLSLWGKGQGIPTTAGAVQVQVLLYKGSTPVQTNILTLPNGNYGFTKKSLAFTAPGAYDKIVIKLIYSKSSGTVWFDGLSLLRSP